MTSAPPLEERMTAAVRAMTLRSPRLTELGGGSESVHRMLDAVEDRWLDLDGTAVHLDVHATDAPKATIVFQPGSGAHARVYFLLGGLLSQRGYRVLAIDRPGHGLSGGVSGDCTVEEAIAAADRTIEYVRNEFGGPVVLMGSSMGGLLTIFGLLSGLRPDLAIAHNFLYPGKLASFRLRSRWIARRRTKPYPLTKLVHGFEHLSPDPAIEQYLRERSDPGFAWALSARSVASLFGFRVRAPDRAPETLVLTGTKDKAIPGWATRAFTRWSGLRGYEYRALQGAGHLLFHDHLDASVPLITDWLDRRLGGVSRRAP